ncbi:hypothetical protein VNO77_03802 [Canavalia gladiata]|uniref:Uncharacterized protein n=1 Tax=Canavalia gladiata TaxID=3824 RepID=A0AAN9MVI1_CANGL
MKCVANSQNLGDINQRLSESIPYVDDLLSKHASECIQSRVIASTTTTSNAEMFLRSATVNTRDVLEKSPSDATLIAFKDSSKQEIGSRRRCCQALRSTSKASPKSEKVESCHARKGAAWHITLERSVQARREWK